MKRVMMIFAAVLTACALLTACGVKTATVEQKNANNAQKADRPAVTATGETGESGSAPEDAPQTEPAPESNPETEPAAGDGAPTEAPTGEAPAGEPTEAPTGEAPAQEPTEAPEKPEETTAAERPTVPAEKAAHTHVPAETAKLVEEPLLFTCGNTECELKKDGKTYRFMYSPALVFGDVVNNLIYDEPPCGCPAEFTVTPEFSPTVEVNLTQGFARSAGGQCSLTSNEIAAFRAALEAVESDAWMREDASANEVYAALFRELHGE